MVDRGRVTGLIDFAEALAQPADAELDTILRWCTRPREFPPVPDGRGLERSTLAEVPGLLRAAYPELFAHERLRERLDVYDVSVQLAIAAHHPRPDVRESALAQVRDVLAGHRDIDAIIPPARRGS